MFRFGESDARRIEIATSDLRERIQRLEAQHAELRARLEAEQALRVFAAQIVAAAQAAPFIGEAIERWACAMRVPPRRGVAGGRARARIAWRYLDGTFMPESAKEEAYFEEYERYARGGRARAATACRWPDGTFC